MTANDDGAYELLVPVGHRLNGEQVDALLYEAENVDNAEDIYETVISHYEAADVISIHDEIRLSEFKQYMEKQEYGDFAERAVHVRDQLYGRDIDIDLDAVREAWSNGEYVTAARRLGSAGKNTTKRVVRSGSRFIGAAQTLSRDGYDGWTQPD